MFIMMMMRVRVKLGIDYGYENIVLFGLLNIYGRYTCLG